MNYKYSFTLPVSVEKAWAVLTDIRRVAPCMPGAAIESGEGSNYVGRMKVKIGPIAMAYKGDLTILQQDDAAHLLTVEGAGREERGGGGAKAVTSLRVVPSGTGCDVSIDSEYSLSGRAGQFAGMVEEIAAKLMREFALRLERLILNGESPAAPASTRTADTPSTARAGIEDSNEALDLIGIGFWPVATRALPWINLILTLGIIVYLLFRGG